MALGLAGAVLLQLRGAGVNLEQCLVQELLCLQLSHCCSLSRDPNFIYFMFSLLHVFR